MIMIIDLEKKPSTGISPTASSPAAALTCILYITTYYVYIIISIRITINFNPIIQLRNKSKLFM